MKNAFTMIELIFVIVILGILAAVAVPRLAATRTDAEITKGRADIASIRSGIVSERQTRLITGDSTYIVAGNGADQLDDGGLFGGVLMYSIADRNVTDGQWTRIAITDVNNSTYNYQINGVTTTFAYDRDDGTFDCATGNADCDLLTN